VFLYFRVQERFTAESAEAAESFGVLRALGGLGGERLLAPGVKSPEFHRVHRVIVPIVIDS
jgi:hypothetical protein